MDSVEVYAGLKSLGVEVDMLSVWVKLIASSVNKRLSILSATMATRCKSVFDNPDFAAEFADLHISIYEVPADKSSIRTILCCCFLHDTLH